MTEQQNVTSADVAGMPPSVSGPGVDPERKWLTIQCPNGHTLTVQDHPGGSRAHCDQCGEWVDYGGYVHDPVGEALKAARLAEARALLEAAGELPAPDNHVVAHDAAAAGDTGQTNA
jgi:hypothetical protein